jgi:hypothetical protein
MKSFSTENLEAWEMALIEKYPLLYKEQDGDNLCWAKDVSPENYCNLRYGFEFEERWAGLADEFSAKASDLVRKARETEPSSFIHGCIFKEKFNSLRWQGNAFLPSELEESYRALIDTMEAQSQSQWQCQTS